MISIIRFKIDYFSLWKSTSIIHILELFLNDEPCRYDRNRYRKENKAIAQEYKELLRISYQTLSEEDKNWSVRLLMFL
jgi:hypothetical protein